MREEFLRSVKCIYKETLDLTEAKNKSKTKRVIVNWKTIVQIKKGEGLGFELVGHSQSYGISGQTYNCYNFIIYTCMGQLCTWYYVLWQIP